MNIDLSKTQQYLDWLKEKLYLDSIAYKACKRIVFRGQVYRCQFGQGIGSEECKDRPCVILQNDSANKTSPNTLVAPISHTSSTLFSVVPINTKTDSSGNIILDGNVLLGNVTCVSKARLGDYITDLTKDEMKQIDKALALSLDLFIYYKTLKNQYDDKLKYIENLKEKRDFLQLNLDNTQKTLEKLNVLLETHGFENLDALEKFLNNN